jgi:uncharacterized protein (TIGR02145 family)
MIISGNQNNQKKINLPCLYFILIMVLIFVVSYKPISDYNGIIKKSFAQISNEIVTDYDGNVYNIVKIGNQVWIIENLKVTHYRDGTPVPIVQDNNKWSQLKTGALCFDKENPESYKKTYGALYNFYAVNDSCGLCPKGWHIPTAEEWKELIHFLGGKDSAGSKMKDIKSDLWKNPIPGTFNESGFCGFPAGGRGRLGGIGEIGYFATWWSSTSHDSLYALHWGLYPDKNHIRYNPGHKASGFSVRCIKDL